METFSPPMIMHSNVLESKCFQMDTGMHSIHIPLQQKIKRPQPKQNQTKSIIKNAKAQRHAAHRRTRGGPKTKRGPAVSDAQGQPKTGLEAQPKPPKRF